MITNAISESGVRLTISLYKEEEHYITWEQRVSKNADIIDTGYFIIGARYVSNNISGTKSRTKHNDCRYGMMKKMQKYRKEWLERKEK